MNMRVIMLFMLNQLRFANCLLNVDIVDVVADFFSSQKTATKVTSFLCWNSENLIFFMKRMNNRNMQLSINRVSTYKEANGRIPFFQDAEHQFYLLDLNCEYAEYILQNANNNGLFNPPFRWLILQNCSNNHDFSKYGIFLNSRMYTINTCKSGNNEYEIGSIYKHSKTKSIVKNDVGVWNNGFGYLNPISDIGNRSNQMGVDVNVTLVIRFKESLDDLEVGRNRKSDINSKHNYMLALCIIDILNVTPNYIYRPTWGLPDPKTGHFDGLYGDLLNGTSQLAGSPLFIVKEKIPYIDFLSHTAPTEASFVFRAPPLSSVSNIFRLPFDSMVWVASIVILNIMFLVLYCIIQCEWSVVKFQETGEMKPTLLDVVQLEIGAVCQQGPELELNSSAGRVGVFFTFLALMFIYTAYSANIVALLQSTTDSINTLEDLYNSKFEFGVHNISFYPYYLKKLKKPIHRLIVDKVLPNGLISLDDGVKRMRTEYYALFGETDGIYLRVIDTYQEHEKCGLIEVKLLSNNQPWVPIKKNSTYKEIVKVGYSKLYEAGIRDRNYRKLHVTKPKCLNPGSSFTSVSINDCYFALVAFVVGLVLSLILLMTEKAIYQLRVKVKNNLVGQVKLNSF